MERLPSEVIAHILDYVDPPDVERASWVCRSFFVASLHPRLVNKLFIGRKTRCNSAIVSQSNFTPDNSTLNLTVQGREKGDDLSWNNANANYPHGPEVKSLVITTDKWVSPYLYVVILSDILNHFPLIEDLELKHINMHVGFLADPSLSNQLQNLIMLKLTFIENLPNFLSGPTMNYLPKIKSLTLETEVSFSGPITKRTCTASVRSVLTIMAFRRICEEYWEILDEIDVTYSKLNEDNMLELCNWLHPNIQTIKLSRCSYIDDDAINVLSCTAQPRILEIDSFLSNSKAKVSGSGVAAIAIRMKSVEYLSYYINENIRLNADLFAAGFLGLHSLIMSSYGERSSHCLVKLTKRKLCVENLRKIDGTDLLVSLSKGSPDLRELSLELICEISDRDIMIIAERFPEIRFLKLDSCCELTDKCLTGVDPMDLSDIDLSASHQECASQTSDGMHRRDVSDSANPVVSLSSDVSDPDGSSVDPSSQTSAELSGVSHSHRTDDPGMTDVVGITRSLDLSSSIDAVNLSERFSSDPSHRSLTAVGDPQRSDQFSNHGVAGKRTGDDRTPGKSAGQKVSNEEVSRWLKSRMRNRGVNAPRRSNLACSLGADRGSQRLASLSGKDGNVAMSSGGVEERTNSAPVGSVDAAHSLAMKRSCNEGHVGLRGTAHESLHSTTNTRSLDLNRCHSSSGTVSHEVHSTGNQLTPHTVGSRNGETEVTEPNADRSGSDDVGFVVCDRMDRRGIDASGTRRLSSHDPNGRLGPSRVARDSTVSNRTRPSQTVVPRRCMRDLKQLRSLCLIGCCELSDRALSDSIAFPLLTYLKLTHCDNLTDRGVEAITLNNPTLDTFILEFCREVTDESVKSAARNLQRIERTKFENCTRLTGAGLNHVIALCPDSLKELYIGGCPVTRAEIEEFKKARPAVKFDDFDW